MKIFDRGSGPAVIVIPGIQGRWEWMRPGIDALSASCRVVTFSLWVEPWREGRFVEKDIQGAYALMQAAAEAGNRLAQFNFAQLVIDRESGAEAMEKGVSY